MDYVHAGMVLSAVLVFGACDDDDAPRETDASGPADTDTDTDTDASGASSDFGGCGSSTCGVVEQCYVPAEGESCAEFCPLVPACEDPLDAQIYDADCEGLSGGVDRDLINSYVDDAGQCCYEYELSVSNCPTSG